MAQSIKLKRSAVVGKTPLTSSLELGELAVNTADGKIYLHRSGSGDDTIQSVLTTDATITGSLKLSGSQHISGSIGVMDNITLKVIYQVHWVQHHHLIELYPLIQLLSDI